MQAITDPNVKSNPFDIGKGISIDKPNPATPPQGGYVKGQPYATNGLQGLTQYDPGVFKDSTGNFFTPGANGQGVYAGNDPSAFKIGGAAGSGGTPPPGTSGNVGGPSGNAGPSGSPGSVSDQLYQQLLSRAHQGTQIDQDDPNIKQQVQPYAAEVERQRRDYMSGVAEKAGQFGNISSEDRLSHERAGQASGLFASGVVGQELQSRRSEIQHALDTLGSRLSADQRLALESELGHLGSSMQQQGLTNQNQQFYSGLSQQDRQFLNQLALQYGGLGSQNDMFAANFGLNATDRANYWDRVRGGHVPGQ